MRSRALFVATLVVLFLLGGMLAVYGSFLVPTRALGVYGWALAIAIGGNLATTLGGGWGTRSVLGAVTPGAGWLVVTLIAGFSRPEGDLVIPSSVPSAPGLGTTGSLFLVSGIVAAGVGVALVQRRFGHRP